MKIDHIGIAVRKIEDALKIYKTLLHSQKIHIEDMPSDAVRIAFIDIGESRIELLEPTSTASPVTKFLERRGEGIHHIAIGVGDINKTIRTLKEQGIDMIDSSPRQGAGGRLVAFVHPKSANGVLIELCE